MLDDWKQKIIAQLMGRRGLQSLGPRSQTDVLDPNALSAGDVPPENTRPRIAPAPVVQQPTQSPDPEVAPPVPQQMPDAIETADIPQQQNPGNRSRIAEVVKGPELQRYKDESQDSFSNRVEHWTPVDKTPGWKQKIMAGLRGTLGGLGTLDTGGRNRLGGSNFAAAGLGGLGGGIIGSLLAPKNAAAEQWKAGQVAQDRATGAYKAAQEKAATDRANTQAETGLRDSQSKYYAGRLQADADKEEGRNVLAAWKNATVFDPADPANAETVALLQKHHIPVLQKDGKHQKTIIHDEESGRNYITETPVDGGAPVTYEVGLDGKPLTTQSSTGARIKSTESENAKNRQSRMELAQYHESQANARAAATRDLAQQRIAQGPEKFKQSHPHFGEPITLSEIQDTAEKLAGPNATEQQLQTKKNLVYGNALKQGLVIQDDVSDNPDTVGAQITGTPNP